MRDTIRSSWEFVEYVFEISGVTRAFTHQLVRTRSGSYAQESQRTVDVRDAKVTQPDSVRDSGLTVWGAAVAGMLEAYSEMMDAGIPAQDARGILPTNVNTSIIAKFSLRTLSEMAKVRLCTRTQGEYQDVFRRMRELVIAEHPWVAEHRFIEVACVADARCAFPLYGAKIIEREGQVPIRQCRFYRSWMHVDPVTRKEHREDFWASEKQVAVPVARGGKTM
jgi:flavin-dependent thymidylate synthase